MPPKKGFGQKLKGVGKAIGRQLKKVPGVAYRDVIKPYGQHLADKFTEEGPAPERLAKLKRTTGRVRPAKILPPAEQVSRPAPKEQTIAEQIAPVSREAKDYGRAGGRTSSYKVGIGSKGAVARLEAERKASQRPLLRRGTQQEKAIRDATKVTTAKPLTDQTRATPKAEPTIGTPKKQTRGTIRGYRIKTTAEVPKKAEPTIAAPKDKPPTSRDAAFTAKRRQQAGLEASRKGKGGKRKFSPKRTGETLRKAGEARREDIAKVGRIDTTAQEMARILTEQEVGREAERAEAALKGGRKPQREKARYRYRTRGLKRSEGRGR